MSTKRPETCADCEYFDPTPTNAILLPGWGVCKCDTVMCFQVMAMASDFYLGKYPIIRATNKGCKLLTIEESLTKLHREPSEE